MRRATDRTEIHGRSVAARWAPAAARSIAIAAGCLGTIAGTPARADEFFYDLRVGAGHSDNIFRTSTDPVGETVLGLGATLDYTYTGSRVEGSLVGDVVYYEYLEDAFDSNVVGNVVADLRAALVPDTLTWVFGNNFGQALTDPFEAVTPDSLENVNYFETGPDLTIRLGSRNSLEVFGRWTDTWYEKNPYNNQGWQGGVALARELARGSTVALNATIVNADYSDLPSDNDYQIQEYFASYEMTGARTSIVAELGYRSLEQYDTTTGGTLLRLQVERTVSAQSTLALQVGSSYGDTASLLQDWQEGSPPAGAETPIVATTTVAQDNYAQLDWTTTGQRTRFGLGAGYHDLSYEGQSELDNHYVQLDGAVSRTIRQSLTVGAQLLWYDYVYDQPGQDYNQLNAVASISWRPVQRFYVDVEAQYYDRSGPAEYDEMQWWLWLGYGSRRP